MLLSLPATAQTDSLPLREIGPYPEVYVAGNVMARMIDALGFRYYHASENLREADLAYRPTPEARSCYETLEHIYGLSGMIVNAPRGDTMVRPAHPPVLDYTELRAATLRRLAEASARYRGKTATEIAGQRLRFGNAERVSEFPLWNMINGPLADAIYHTGQVVTFRRTMGNPVRRGVNVFRGTVAPD